MRTIGQVLLMVALVPLAAAAQTETASGPRVAAPIRLAVTAEVPGQGGQAQTLRLALGDIKVSGRKRVEVPPSGFYVATLVTNDIFSIEGDKRVLRHTGDSWEVQAGQSLVMEPQGKNHLVLLEVFRVEPNPVR
jgi:hypothetical protein